MSKLATRKSFSNMMFRCFCALFCLVTSALLALGQSPETSPPASLFPPAEPVVPVDPVAKYQIEKGLTMFQHIKDDAIFPWTSINARELGDAPGDQMEERAYDEVLRHARQFPVIELEQHARRDVALRELFTAGRKSYKLDLMYFEGRLKRLARSHPTDILKASGITDVYEAWVFPKNEIEPLCVLITELPPGLTLPANGNEDVNLWVGIAGYYFKLLRYESQQLSKSTKGEYVSRRAPVLMGRSITVIEEPESATQAWRTAFLPIIVGGVASVAFVIFGLSWYYRKTDAAVKAAIENKLTKNPFA